VKDSFVAHVKESYVTHVKEVTHVRMSHVQTVAVCDTVLQNVAV